MQEKVEQVQSFMGQASDLVDFDKNLEQIVSVSQSNFFGENFENKDFPRNLKILQISWWKVLLANFCFVGQFMS